jgi:D-arabinose 1-dehydrogenase-like Zn-dependent alcohol dehydrogenase
MKACLLHFRGPIAGNPAKIPIQPEVQIFPLEQANAALNALKNDAIRGADVLMLE